MPGILITVPTNKIAAVEKILKKKIGENQVPVIRVRVPENLVDRVRKAIKK